MCRPRRGIPHTPTTCASRRLLTWSMFGPFLQMPKYLGAVHGATRPRNSLAPQWDKRRQAKGSVGRISKEGIWLQREEGAREIDSPEMWIRWRSGFSGEINSLEKWICWEKGERWRREGAGGHVADARGPLVKPPSRTTWIGLIQNELDFSVKPPSRITWIGLIQNGLDFLVKLSKLRFAEPSDQEMAGCAPPIPGESCLRSSEASIAKPPFGPRTCNYRLSRVPITI
jgi:hypothetical protein